MQYLLTTCLAALAALSASALTPANVDQPPSGNSIGKPSLHDLMVAGEPYTITWTPDTGDYISLVLLRGPSTNVVPIETIVENIPNSGSYTWDPVPRHLEADTTGYGIQLIVEGTGQYQYSTQFGVENEASTETDVETETGNDIYPDMATATATETEYDGSEESSVPGNMAEYDGSEEGSIPSNETVTLISVTEEASLYTPYPVDSASPTAPMVSPTPTSYLSETLLPSSGFSASTSFANSTGNATAEAPASSTVSFVLATGAAPPMGKFLDGATMVIVAGAAGLLAF